MLSILVGQPNGATPFSHLNGTMAEFKVRSRDEAITRYTIWLHELPQSHLLTSLHELEGKDLVCWCSPAACHGHVLFSLANGE